LPLEILARAVEESKMNIAVLYRLLPYILFFLGLGAVPPSFSAYACAVAGGQGDDFVQGVVTSTNLHYGQEDLIDAVSALYGTELADDIETYLDNDANLVEMEQSEQPGTSDRSTIVLNTSNYPLYFCAVVLVHEYRHSSAARTPETEGPSSFDPTTGDASCGKCAHAAMYAADADVLAAASCECPLVAQCVDPSPCELYWQVREYVCHLLSDCAYDGCQSCCGFPYVPNESEVLTATPCCP